MNTPSHPVLGRRDATIEIVIVLGLSLGLAGVRALVRLIGRLTGPEPLSAQAAVLNGSFARGRPWLDLALQLVSLTAGVMPALLAVYLLARTGTRPAAIGIDTRAPRQDATRGAGLAALIGLPGLGVYLLAYAVGISVQVVAADLPAVWWRLPVLVLSAVQNAALEEIVVVAYLLTRLGELGWRPGRALAASAVLRGSYHLYQGFGGFVGNVIMGVIFGWVFQRTRRVLPLILGHALIDTVAFVGYTLLRGHVGWLPDG